MSLVLGIILVTKVTSGVFEEYPAIQKQESVAAVVAFVKSYKGTTLIEFTNAEKTSFIASQCAEEGLPLFELCSPGDSILKHSGSDIVVLVKFETKEKFEFEIRYYP